MKKIKSVLRICNDGSSMYSYLSRQILDIKKNNFSIFIVCSNNKKLYDFCKKNRITYLPIDFERRFSFVQDVKCLWLLYKFYLKYKIDISHSWNTKAGLLNSIIATLFFVNLRIHTFAGIPWENYNFAKSLIPRISDFIIIFFNHKCFADSLSEAKLLNEKLFTKKIKVLGHGSLAGVNLNKFNLHKYTRPVTHFSKYKYNIIFVGRITKEKGVDDLVKGFISFGLKDCGLTILGNVDNTNGSIEANTFKQIQNHDRIKWIKHTQYPERFYKYADISILPSYREGFGNVVIEAACFKVPTFGYDCTGLKDSIVHKKTGFLVKKGDYQDLFININKYLISKSYIKLGENAYKRAVAKFDSKKVSGHVINEYF